MRIAAVVVNWNGGEQNLPCVRALLAQGLACADIAFVDNGSRDGSREAVHAAHPGLTRIDNPSNLGYGAATNQGIAWALSQRYDAVFLVNNDLELPAGALALLRAALERSPGVGIVAPRVLYKRYPGVIWSAGGRLTWRQNLSVLIGQGQADGPAFQRTVSVDYVAGCALLARREVFERVGLLEADYFAYHEDLEFCLKAREAGFDVQVVGAAHALHESSGSTGGGYSPRRKYMMGVNTVWFLKRHGSPLRWASFALFDVLSLVPLAVASPFTGRAKGVLAKGLGIWHGLRGRKVDPALLEPGAGPWW